MKLSELIKRLQEIEEQYGDLDCVNSDMGWQTGPVEIEVGALDATGHYLVDSAKPTHICFG